LVISRRPRSFHKTIHFDLEKEKWLLCHERAIFIYIFGKVAIHPTKSEWPQMNDRPDTAQHNSAIAIVGMAGRFPGAASIDEFWKNLCDGVESVTVFSDEELRRAGVPEALITDPGYVKKNAIIDETDLFDAGFFGINPREAEVMDPQHRLFLECAWEALENAGYDPEKYPGLIGVYAGNGTNQYMLKNLSTRPDLIETVGDYLMMTGNDNDYLATRVSYKLNLRGPSMTILSACSTSLVVVHTACQGLVNHECDMALAGGVSLKIPQRTGYLFKEGYILSPDGHCRAFDENARGTFWGEGLGIVVLKRLSEAIKDNDSIYAVIRGTAVNNDGSGKLGFTAPSVEGQAAVIRVAQENAGIDPRTVSYIETHGAGTQLGDPIEIAGLVKAFNNDNGENKHCALGSVKTNIGHLDAAAGIAGLMKTVLALKHGVIPPTLHFSKPNPRLELDRSPFFIPTETVPWKAPFPRRAGVSSFGIGGTNAHAVLEEAPAFPTEPGAKKWHVLPLSARSEHALESAAKNMAEFLKGENVPDIADIARTLQAGRRAFSYRRVVVCRTVTDAADAFDSNGANRGVSGNVPGQQVPVVFMFSGQGSQFVNMSKRLYEHEPVYREKVDYCCGKLAPLLGIDLRNILFPQDCDRDSAGNLLSQTLYTQPALFVLEYCLAGLFMSWGIQPKAMIGHSVGEYVAACLSGVFGLDDALRLIVERAKIMQEQPSGVMLSISAPEERIKEYLEPGAEIALMNGPQLFVVGGLVAIIDSLDKKLTLKNIQHTRLRTSHAFHTALMDGAVEPFAGCVSQTTRHAPTIPFISNVSGTWITPEMACDSAYWASHLRSVVRFSSGMEELLKAYPRALFVEIGPGNTLCVLGALHAAPDRTVATIQTLPHALQQRDDAEMFLSALGRLWALGASVDWTKTYGSEPRRRVSLPTYPFERKRFWIGPSENAKKADQTQLSSFEEKNDASRGTKKVSAQPHVGEAHPRPELPNAYSPATTAVEEHLVELWQRIIGIEPVGILDNFFEMGGHSLLAVKIFDEIFKKYNVRLPLAALIEFNTVRALAAHIREAAVIPEDTAGPVEASNAAATAARKPVWNTVVTIQPEGDLPPFFCAAGIGGNPMNFVAVELGKRQPFYALQYRGVDGVLQPHETVEDMAAEFLADIRRVQSKGPYYLGGYSFGGLVAYEMVQQLLRLEEQVGGLVLLDTENLLNIKWTLKERIRSHWSKIRSIGPGYIINLVRRRLITHESQKQALVDKNDLFAHRLDLVAEKNWDAALRYIPLPLDADVVLIKSKFQDSYMDGIGFPPHESNGWRSLLAPGRLEIRLMESSHLGMMEAASAAETARKIAESLEWLRAKAQSK
jgi:phthiocerol/phenolphthiocerol synthesis type-I polyketide synthase E